MAVTDEAIIPDNSKLATIVQMLVLKADEIPNKPSENFNKLKNTCNCLDW